MKKTFKEQKREKIGILGGSFDPIHSAHIELAKAAYKSLGLDKIIFIPARQAALKDSPVKASGKHRVAMLKIALKKADFAHEINLSEINRTGISYSIDTVREILKNNPDNKIFWIIGSDHLSKISAWKEAETLCKLVTFACAKRGGFDETFACAPKYARLVPIDFNPVELSSTQLRNDLKNAQTANLKLDPEVLQYILKNKLYL